MDRGEPSLVPEWLKNNNGSGGGGGGGGRQPYFSSSSLRQDDHSAVKHTRSASSANSGVTSSDRTTASYFRRNSGARGSAHLQSYGSFGSRSNRNGVHEDSIGFYDKDKLTVGIGVNKDSNHSDQFGSGLQRKFQKDELQRSKSMNGSRDEDTRRRNINGELSNGRNNFHGYGTVSLGKETGTNKINKPSFEQDFPSLVSEDNRVGSEIGRVPSPGFQRQLNPTSDGWTSALVEVPATNGSGSASGLVSVQIASGVSAPPPSQCTVAPNMAEAVAQAPVRARTPPELSANTQRLEELAIKKSKQLIPMTPIMPRSHMTISSDKSKTRMVQPPAKTPHSLSSSQPVRAGPVRLDVLKSANSSKLQILKPSKDLNGVSAAGKESLGSPNVISTPVSALSMASTTGGSPAVNSTNLQSLAGLERKPAIVSTILEKKPSLQARSRNDFFNHLKKKSSSGNSPASSHDHSSSTSLPENADLSRAMTIDPDMKNGPASDSANGVTVSISGGEDEDDYCTRVTQSTMVNGEEPLCPPNEEEAAFMRSLGWEEGSGEGGGLTEEEINSFLEQRSKDRSLHSLSLEKIALKLKAGQNKCLGT